MKNSLTQEEQNLFDGITSKNLLNATIELREQQQFSFQSLKELHDKTFFPNPSAPEKVREQMSSYFKMRPEDDNWQKPRVGLTPYPYLTRYSPLEKSDFQNAENAIRAAKPENMQNLSFDEKVKRLANVYAEIDYLHAFWDGNSRVNRAFVQELARSSGIKIDFDTNKISEKDMYIARDKSLAELNLSRRGEDLKKLGYKPNPYNEQKEIFQDLNTYYPNVSLFSVFKNAASEIKIEQVKTSLTAQQWEKIGKKMAELHIKNGGSVKVNQPIEQAKIQPKTEGEGEKQKSPKYKP